MSFSDGSVVHDNPGSVKIVDGNFDEKSEYWNEMRDFDNKTHGNKTHAVDLGSRHLTKRLVYGPNSSFIVNSAETPVDIYGSKISITLLDNDGNATDRKFFVGHLNEINSAIYNAEPGQVFNPGTYIGRSTQSLGMSTGPYGHFEINNENAWSLHRKNLQKWLRGN